MYMKCWGILTHSLNYFDDEYVWSNGDEWKKDFI